LRLEGGGGRDREREISIWILLARYLHQNGFKQFLFSNSWKNRRKK
jgi:hypothetical protein